MAYIHQDRQLCHQEHGNVVDKYINLQKSFRGGMQMVLNKEAINIDPHHHGNINRDDQYLKPPLCKKPKLEGQVEDRQLIFQQGASSYTNNSYGFDSAARETVVSTTNSISLRSLLENDKLNGWNFLNWLQKLKNVLKFEEKEYVLEKTIPERPPSSAALDVRNSYNKHKDDATDVQCLMLGNMEPYLQKRCEKMEPYEMIKSLEALFQKRERSERYAILNVVLNCKLVKGNPVCPHVEKMIGLIQRLEKLGSPISQELAVDFILRSLPHHEYGHFITNFHTRDCDKSMYELHGMLRTVEIENHKRAALLIQEKKCIQKKAKNKCKGNGNGQIKNLNKADPDQDRKPQFGAKSEDPKSQRGAKNEDVCHHCKEIGHWKRNCKKYLEELKI